MRQFFKFLFASCLGTILALIIVSLLGIGIFGSMAARMDKKVSVSQNSVLKLDFKMLIPEHTNNTPLTGFSLENEQILGLHRIIDIIEYAGEDDNIKGIYLAPQFLALGQSSIVTLRKALDEFKQTGKFVIAYQQSYDQSSYLLASIADEVHVHPFGMVDFRGFAALVPFFPEVMDKLGIDANIYYAGQFKSATEPFRLKQMSPQNKFQTREYLNDQYDIYLEQIASSRAPSKEKLEDIADHFKARTAQDAVNLGMIDAISYEEDVFNQIRAKIGIDEDKKLRMVGLNDYSKVAQSSFDYKVKDKIAIVFAEGNIIMGEGEEGNIGGQKYAKLLRKLRKDDQIKGVVLRVNSGGGSVMASENILHEVKELKAAGKPVVASFGDVSASGGYYISCHADKILCEPNTITGSIGVFMMAPNFEDMFQEKIGIQFDTVNTGNYSSSFTLVYDWNDKEGRFLQAQTDNFYDIFLTHVAEGRNMTKDEVHQIAQGRVWSGRKALEIGLVDELGGLDRAVEIAAELAGLEKYRTSNYPRIKDPLIRLIEDITGQESPVVSDHLIQKKLGKDLGPYYKALSELKTLEGAQARIPFTIYAH